ncbi:MAG: Ig-like domain-containing protein [Rhodoglobus sp.]
MTSMIRIASVGLMALGIAATGLVGTAAAQATGLPPVGQEDFYSMPQGGTLTIAAPGVLANDSDAEGDALHVGNSFNYQGADSVSVNLDGSFSFTPAASFYGQGSFSYYPSDDTNWGAEVTVHITVDPTVVVAPTAPVASDDSYSTPKGVTLTVPAASGLLANDSVPAYIGAVNAPDGGVVVQQDGSFVYTPPAGFVGTTMFGYRTTDGVTQSNDAMVTITVTDPSVPPVQTVAPIAVDDHYSVQQDTQLVIDAASGLLANDSDGGNSGFVVDGVTAGQGGTMVAAVDGSFVFTPTAGFVGTVHLVYSNLAGGIGSNFANIYIVVTAAPAPPVDPGPVMPVANADSYTTPMDTPLSVDVAGGLLANDNNAIAVAENDTPAGLSLNPQGDFVYTPAAGFVGTVTFNYTVTDGITPSLPATVTIVVTAPVVTGTTVATVGTPDDAGQLTTLAYTGGGPSTGLLASAVALFGLGLFGLWISRRRAA